MTWVHCKIQFPRKSPKIAWLGSINFDFCGYRKCMGQKKNCVCLAYTNKLWQFSNVPLLCFCWLTSIWYLVLLLCWLVLPKKEKSNIYCISHDTNRTVAEQRNSAFVVDFVDVLCTLLIFCVWKGRPNVF